MKKYFSAVLIILVLFLTVHIQSFAHIKPDTVSLSDYSGVLSEGVKNYIKSKNDILSANAGAKIIIVTTESTEDMVIDDYCIDLYNKWGIAKMGRNNNIFFVVDTTANEYSFVRGKSIRLAITENEVYQYIIDNFEPYFSKGNYDKAIMSFYNAMGKWYEDKYKNLNLGLDNHIQKYLTGNQSKDADPKESNWWIWIVTGIVIIITIILLKIKRNIELKYRQLQRRRLRKKFQIDVDKIVNS